MNKVKIILVLFFVTAMYNCSNKEEIVPELTISNSVVNFNGYGGTQSFNINSNIPWNISVPANEKWFTVTPLSNNKSGKVTVSVTNNTSYYSRVVYLSINAGNLSERFVIHQRGKPYLKVLQDYYELDSQHHLLDIYVETYESGFDDPKADVDWIFCYGFSLQTPVYPTIYKVYFTVEENSSAVAREGIITFTNQGVLSVPVIVRQAGKQ